MFPQHKLISTHEASMQKKGKEGPAENNQMGVLKKYYGDLQHKNQCGIKMYNAI